jgi:hypothetical protein
MSAILLDACRAFLRETALRLHRWHRRRPQQLCTPGCKLAPHPARRSTRCRDVGGAQVVGPLGDLEHMRRLLGDGALLDAGDLVRSAAKPSQANCATSRIVSLSISSAPASSRHPPPPRFARARMHARGHSPGFCRQPCAHVAVLRCAAPAGLADRQDPARVAAARARHTPTVRPAAPW